MFVTALFHQAQILLHQMAQCAHRIVPVQHDAHAVGSLHLLIRHSKIGTCRQHIHNGIQQFESGRSRLRVHGQNLVTPLRQQLRAGFHLGGIGLVDDDPVGRIHRCGPRQRPGCGRVIAEAGLKDRGHDPDLSRKTTPLQGTSDMGGRSGPSSRLSIA